MKRLNLDYNNIYSERKNYASVIVAFYSAIIENGDNCKKNISSNSIPHSEPELY